MYAEQNIKGRRMLLVLYWNINVTNLNWYKSQASKFLI